MDKETYQRLERIFFAMKRRCYNPSNNKYKIYGARGIKLCDEWVNNKKEFMRWAVNNGYQADLTIDRIDVNGNYEPNNCRWITLAEQSRNKRDTLYLTIDNKTQPLVNWCRKFNVNYMTVKNRYNQFKKYKIEITDKNVDTLFKPVGYYTGNDLLKLIYNRGTKFEKLITHKRLEKHKSLKELSQDFEVGYDFLNGVLVENRKLTKNLVKKIFLYFTLNDKEKQIVINRFNECHRKEKLSIKDIN